MLSVTLTTIAIRSSYITVASGRIIEVTHATEATSRESDGYLVSRDGEAVAIVQKWGERDWSVQDVRQPSSPDHECGQADLAVMATGVHLVSASIRGGGHSRKAALAARGWAA